MEIPRSSILFDPVPTTKTLVLQCFAYFGWVGEIFRTNLKFLVGWIGDPSNSNRILKPTQPKNYTYHICYVNNQNFIKLTYKTLVSLDANMSYKRQIL